MYPFVVDIAGKNVLGGDSWFNLNSPIQLRPTVILIGRSYVCDTFI